MITISSVHQPLLQLSQQSGAANPVTAEADSGQSSPVPTTDQATRKVRGAVEGQGAQFAHQQSGQGSKESEASHESISPSLGHDHRRKLVGNAERQQVEDLSQRDREVRAHEAAHLAAAGQHATNGAKYTFTRGPDGRSYAIGGSVDIDTSAEINPEATIRKADQIRRAALAPADPSSQDRAVAAQATSMRVQAQSDLVKLNAEEKQQRIQAETASWDKSTLELQTNETSAVNNHTDKSPNTNTDNHNQSESLPSTCAVCGGSHGSDGHVAANQAKIDANYQGSSALAGQRGSSEFSLTV